MFELNSQLTTTKDFTNAIGEFFRSGTVFTVIHAGPVNSKLLAPNGSQVWLDGSKAHFIVK